MVRVMILLALPLSMAAGCAMPPRAPAGLAMPAGDEGYAASLLASYLLAQGWTVRLATPTLVAAYRNEESLELEPLLEPDGLDRIIVSRVWPRDPGAADESLHAFALELNDALNVGQFRAVPAGLSFQSSLPFLEELEPRLLDAFLAHTAEVRLAVLHVQANRRLLAPVEAGEPSR
jgi:hypothetical protein